ncbi:MAG: diguanylate cyclase [Lachnospiraceae bacterium]|nr:diguanylate cyclase [Lachnospiraceae bacterium]
MDEEMYREMKKDLRTYIMKEAELFDSLPLGMAILKGDTDLQIEFINDEFFHSLDYSMEEILEGDRNFYCFCCEEDKSLLEEMRAQSLQNRKLINKELRFLSKNGESRWLLLGIRFHEYRDGIPYFLVTSQDIDDCKKMGDEIRLQTERYKLLEEAVNEFPLEYDVQKGMIKISNSMRERYGFSKEEASVEEIIQIIHEDDREKIQKIVKEVVSQETGGVVEYRIAAGKEEAQPYIWHKTRYKSVVGSSGRIIQVVGRIYDVDKEKRIHNQLEEKARKDPMTGLLNKQVFQEDIESFFKEEPDRMHALMVIDIDDFKTVNDTFGHIFGDVVIKDVAGRISEKFRGLDIIGRVGGDEFAVLMKRITEEHARMKAQSLCEAMRKKYVENNMEHTITCSVGISFFGKDGKDYETLFKKADFAMYQAKVNGKDGYQIIDEEANTRNQEYKIVSERK